MCDLPTEGSIAAYVTSQLELAQKEAQTKEIGEEFQYTLTNIPHDIPGPHQIMLMIMMKADEYGLRCEYSMNETFVFVRVK